MQDELPKFLRERGFAIERGVEQQKGSAKKHLDTREFKQQQEMIESMRREGEDLLQSLMELQKQMEAARKRKSELDQELESQMLKIEESANALKDFTTLPAANFFNYREVIAYAQEKLEQYQKALADKESLKRDRDNKDFQIKKLIEEREATRKTIQMAKEKIMEFKEANQKFAASLEKVKASAKMEMAEMNEFIMARGNHLRYQEFLLQRKDERNAQTELSKKEDIRQTMAQSANNGMRMR